MTHAYFVIINIAAGMCARLIHIYVHFFMAVESVAVIPKKRIDMISTLMAAIVTEWRMSIAVLREALLCRVTKVGLGGIIC